LFYNYGKKSGFYSGILLGFAVQKKKREILLLPSKNLIYFIFYQEEQKIRFVAVYQKKLKIFKKGP
jgi:hypothetical protein